jgi:hypothetical protein
MPNPVTPKGTFTCAHSGTAHPAGTSKLTVADQPVLPFSAADALMAYEKCTNPDNAGGKCAKTIPMPAVANPGAAVHLTVGGAPALLDALTANTNPPAPPGTPLASVKPGQTRLTAT